MVGDVDTAVRRALVFYQKNYAFWVLGVVLLALFWVLSRNKVTKTTLPLSVL